MTYQNVGKRAMSAPRGLYEYVRANQWRSLVLFAGFLLAFQLMAVAMLGLPLVLLDWRHAPIIGGGGYTERYMLPVTVAGALLFLVSYWWHVSGVQKDTNFHYVDDRDEPRLCGLLEPLITLAGIRTPYVAVIESTALNAFACGVRQSHMVVVVTRGLIDSLDDEELEAVLAHELIHIRNHDTRLMAAANAFIDNLTWMRSKSGKFDINNLKSGICLALVPVFLPVLLLVNFVAQLSFRIGYLSRAVIGSSREFIADAEAVRLTQNPAAMISALRKVDGRDEIGGFSETNDAMLIAGAVEGPAATHPLVAQRIAALIQVTGPATAYAPMRRDTRTPEQRRRSGFGRALGQDMVDMVAGAERPTLWQILRQTRDPDRNIFGVNRKGVLVIIAAMVVLVGGYGPFLLKIERARSATSFDAHGLANLGDLMHDSFTCQFKGIAHVMGRRADLSPCDRVEKAMGHPAGISSAQAAIAVEENRNRCFGASFHDWPNPRPLALDESGGSDVERMDWYRRSSVDQYMEWVNWPAGPKQDEELIDYATVRPLLIDHVYYNFGRPGVEQFRAWSDSPAHRTALRLFLQRSRDPAFVEVYQRKYNSSDLEAAKLVATYPDQALPCAALRAEHRFVESAPVEIGLNSAR